MPQPITTTSTDRQAVPRQRDGSHPPSVRALREQEWRTLVGSYRLFTRLTVEALKHHRVDDADTLARQGALLEEELEHAYPSRWSRHRPELLPTRRATSRSDRSGCSSSRTFATPRRASSSAGDG